MEGIKSRNPERQMTEAEADERLQKLLEDPEYQFLSTIPQNLSFIENAESAREALRFAEEVIDARESRTFVFRPTEGIEAAEVTYRGLRRTMREIERTRREIGEGGDAFVYVSESDKVNGRYDLCYKFSKAKALHLGRNTTEQELDMQSQFFSVVEQIPDHAIGVPQPMYYCEMGTRKMIAMEYLQARSIDDLRLGKGSVPAWFDDTIIKRFGEELTRTIDTLHANGLYHRDLHLGNIMITQTQKPTEILGYIIDFGVSGYGQEGLEPYRTEVLGKVFTYDNDYGRIEAAQEQLMRLRRL